MRKGVSFPKADVSEPKARIAVIVSQFHKDITDRLLEGAKECFRQHGISKYDVFHCPGSFELPQVAQRLVKERRWDAVVCLGAVIRGKTSHFEYVASETARGIQDVALRSGIPVLFGVLTTENEKQALERAGGKFGNKGWDAAVAAIEMNSLFKRLERGTRRSL
ncbi:MAG: 6,7-dimethyl-8-ribityllumazine synthase [Ignavibacteriales bacterium]|nr:6,7-dimethyl-8-ribityllumazine synthase [Ignavibacteriales bacterium]